MPHPLASLPEASSLPAEDFVAHLQAWLSRPGNSHRRCASQLQDAIAGLTDADVDTSRVVDPTFLARLKTGSFPLAEGGIPASRDGRYVVLARRLQADGLLPDADAALRGIESAQGGRAAPPPAMPWTPADVLLWKTGLVDRIIDDQRWSKTQTPPALLKAVLDAIAAAPLHDDGLVDRALGVAHQQVTGQRGAPHGHSHTPSPGPESLEPLAGEPLNHLPSGLALEKDLILLGDWTLSLRDVPLALRDRLNSLLYIAAEVARTTPPPAIGPAHPPAARDAAMRDYLYQGVARIRQALAAPGEPTESDATNAG